MWNRAEGKAWPVPNDHMDDNEQYYEKAMRACEEFGIRTCESVNDFNFPKMDSQLILLAVSNDKKLKIEVE